jgi:hypothetical protein
MPGRTRQTSEGSDQGGLSGRLQWLAHPGHPSLPRGVHVAALLVAPASTLGALTDTPRGKVHPTRQGRGAKGAPRAARSGRQRCAPRGKVRAARQGRVSKPPSRGKARPARQPAVRCAWQGAGHAASWGASHGARCGKVGELTERTQEVLGWSSTSSATAGGCHSTRAAQKAVSTAQALTGLWSRCSYPRPSGLRTPPCRSRRCPACRWRCQTGAWPHHSGRCRTVGSPRASPRPGWPEAG